MRWHLLDLARLCRRRLQLRDRDIAVLRGLLSLLPNNARPDQLVIFASNRVLIARCDGIDERTLRRRLALLQEVGLITRRSSPNGKRYQIRNPEAGVNLSYGFDLTPIFARQSDLEALAAQSQQEALQVKALRALIRDRLYHCDPTTCPDLCDNARRALRRSLTPQALRTIAEALPVAAVASQTDKPELQDTALLTENEPCSAPCQPPVLTVRDGQNDRHIQKSGKEYFDSEAACDEESSSITSPAFAQKEADLTLDQCMEIAVTARAFAPCPPGSWQDVIALSDTLAPAIGLTANGLRNARDRLGRHGCALAVLGLMEAFGRIRSPGAYLNSLVKRAESQPFDIVRMFRSLARPGRAISGV